MLCRCTGVNAEQTEEDEQSHESHEALLSRAEFLLGSV